MEERQHVAEFTHVLIGSTILSLSLTLSPGYDLAVVLLCRCVVAEPGFFCWYGQVYVKKVKPSLMIHARVDSLAGRSFSYQVWLSGGKFTEFVNNAVC